MPKKQKLLEYINSGKFDAYLLESVDKTLLMDIDILIQLAINGISIEDIIKVCPEIIKYRKIVERIKSKLIESNNTFCNSLNEGYLIYVGVEIMDYYADKNKLEPIFAENNDNEWFRNFFIPGFKNLFEICINGIPENFDDICDEILKIKQNGVTIKEQLSNLNKWINDYEFENVGMEYDIENFKYGDNDFDYETGDYDLFSDFDSPSSNYGKK